MLLPAALPPSYSSVQTVMGTPISKNRNRPYGDEERIFYPCKENELNPLLDTQIKEELGHLLKHLNKFMAAALKIGFESPKQAIPFFIHTWNLLTDLEAEKITIDNTLDDTILVRAAVDDTNLYLDFYTDDDLPNGYEVIVSVYRDKKNVLSVSGGFEFVSKHLFQYFKIQASTTM